MRACDAHNIFRSGKFTDATVLVDVGRTKVESCCKIRVAEINRSSGTNNCHALQHAYLIFLRVVVSRL